MSYDDFSSFRRQFDVNELLKRVMRSSLMQDKVTTALVGFIFKNPNDKERIEQLLRRPGVRELMNNPDPFYDAPTGIEIDGPVRLGECKGTGALFGLHPKELMQGVLVVGRPGAGKTTLACNLIESAVKNGFVCVILDVKKDYRSLITKIPRTGIVWPEHLQPLFVPEGVRIKKHISTFSDLTCESMEVYEGTKSFLRRHLTDLYKKKERPTLEQLYRAITEEKHPHYSREARYQESAESRIGSMVLMGESEDGTNAAYRIEELIEKFDVIVIELDRLDRTGRICYASLVLGWIFEHRIENNLRGDAGKPLLLLIDEGNEIFVREYERRHGGTTLSSFIRQAREFNIAPVCFCHLPLDLSDNLKNVYTRILMSLGEGFNLKSMADSMGLLSAQRDINYNLDEGQAIVRLAGRYHKAFTIQFLPYELEKNVTNEEVQKHMQPHFDSLAEELPEATPAQADAEAEAREAETDAKLKPFLMDVYNMPFEYLTARYKRLDVPGDSIKRQLLKQGLCEVITINLGGKGGSAKFLAFFDTGFQFLGVPSNHRIHKSNFEHSFWEDRISKWVAPLGKVEIEKLVQSKHTDVGLITEHGLFAFEVELQNAWLVENAKRNISAGYLKTIHCCKETNFTEAKSMVAGLDEAIRAKVYVYLLTEVTRSNPHEFFKSFLNGKEGEK